MGIVILIFAVVIEDAFAVYCIVTQSSQDKTRNLLRIGELAAFVACTLAAVIEWSARWYGLCALLLAWAALAVWRLLRKPQQEKPYSVRKTVFGGMLALLLVGIAVVPALVFPQYQLPPMTGKHQVVTVSYTYTDQSRIETFTSTGENRKVNVEFWYPEGTTGRYPLVVFSHGAFGMKAGNASTFIELASNGYVVCSIDHPYHSLYTRGSDGRTVTIAPSFLQEVMNLDNGKYDELTGFQLEQKWIRLRKADIHFVLDTIIRNAKDPESGAVYQLIDAGKIGLMGHSLGGEASAQVGRERNDIGAIIDLDADLGGEYLDYANGKYTLNDKVYPDPLLIIFTDEMVRRFARVTDPNLVIASRKVVASAPQAYEIDIPGTNHMSLTDLPLVSPFLVSMINSSFKAVGGSEADSYSVIKEMNSITLNFFDVYLKNQGSFNPAEKYNE